MSLMSVLIFVLLIVAAVVIVGGWVVFSLGRGLMRLFFGAPASPKTRQIVSSRGNGNCNRPECHADNPAHAQFCRRCGEPLSGGSIMGVRRVA